MKKRYSFWFGCGMAALLLHLSARAPAEREALPADYLERCRASLEAVASHLGQRSGKREGNASILWVRYGFGALVLGRRVDEINRFFESNQFSFMSNPKFGFSLFSTEYMRLYGLFNSRAGPRKGRLSQAAQENFEKGMWEVARSNSRLAEAKRGVWDVEGSENHHLSSKISDFLAAQYLRNLSEYAGRKYDDGSTLSEQYETRRAYWLQWFDERAKHGQFTEAGSPSYQGDSINAIFNLRDFAEDPVLRKKADMYLDLTYANIAEETLLTTRGGPKSRVKVGHEYDGGMCDRGYDLLFNAPGRTFVPLGDNTLSTSDYYPAPAIVNLARDTRGRGAYVFAKRWPGPLAAARGKGSLPGEGDTLWRTLDAQKSILRYGFATPDYVTGSAGVHLDMPENDAASGFRWQGIVFASDPLARIGFEVQPANDKDWHGFNPFATVQDRNLFVTQQWAPVPPNPRSANPAHLRVYFSPTLDDVREEDGWIFVKDGAAFAAVRVVRGGYAWTPAWQHADALAKNNKSFITLKSEDSPVITIANQASDYKNDFNSFKAAVRAQPIRWEGGILRFATIEFQGPAQAGKVSGQPVNLAPPLGYDSPFIRSEWGSGLIYIRKGNDTEILDFRDPKCPVKTVGAPVSDKFPTGIGSARPIVFTAGAPVPPMQ